MGKVSKVGLVRMHYPLLKHLAKCSSKDCKYIVQGSSDQFIKLLTQICVNVMNKTLTRNEGDAVKKLSPYKKDLIAITKPKTPLKKKRKILEQKGGFIGALLSIALPVITSLIGRLVSGK